MFGIVRTVPAAHRDIILVNEELQLSEARVGYTYQMVDLDAGRQLRERIASMGLNHGACFRIIANSGHGPVGLAVGRTRLGLGRGMALKIRVREVEPDL